MNSTADPRLGQSRAVRLHGQPGLLLELPNGDRAEIALQGAHVLRWRAREREQLAAARVLVVGDAMLDRYWHGSVDRISPEAPVPVVRVVREWGLPGGAANVSRNIAALGGRAVVAGVATMTQGGLVKITRPV